MGTSGFLRELMPSTMDKPIGASPDQITALQELMLATETLQDFLGQVAEQAALIAPELSCGITVSTNPRRPLTVGSSDATAAQLDETQYSQGDGPCLEAMRIGKVVEVADATSESRWGAYIPAAVKEGLGASLSTPVTANGVTIGVMNIYATKPRIFTADERARAQAYASQAAAAIAIATRLADHAQLTEDLRSAMVSRATIDQALGILMGELRCNADEAFAILRKRSQETNTKLRDVAAAVITRTTGEAPRPAPSFD